MARPKNKTRDTRSKVRAKAPAIPTLVPNVQRSLLQTLTTASVFEDSVAEAKAQRTVDGFDNFVSRLGLNNDNTLSAGTYTFNLMTRNRIKLEAAYRGSWIVGAVVDSVPEDMTRAGVTINTNEGDADIADLQTAISRLQIWDSLQSVLKWGRLYGGAIGVLQIAGQSLDTPLNVDTIGKDQFKGIVSYDRWQLNPDLNRVIRQGPNMGLPEYYQIVNDPRSTQADFATPSGALTVHHSRVIRVVGIELPYFQAITEMMWGESILERLWDRLISFDNATLSAAQLIDRANLRTVGIDGLREIIAAGGKAQQGLSAMFEMMRLMQVNEGLTLLDKNDTFQSTSYSFSGLAETLLQFGQQLSGASGIPLVRLFGQSPAGLSATGDADIRMYYDNINAQQESRLRNPWETILQVMWRSTFGKPAPKDLSFKFTPLWQMTAMDKASITKTNVESVATAYDTGFIDRATGMKELRLSSADSGMFTNISDEAIEEAENEAPPAPEIEIDPESAKVGEVKADPQTESAETQVAALAKDAKPKRWWKRQ